MFSGGSKNDDANYRELRLSGILSSKNHAKPVPALLNPFDGGLNKARLPDHPRGFE